MENKTEMELCNEIPVKKKKWRNKQRKASESCINHVGQTADYSPLSGYTK